MAGKHPMHDPEEIRLLLVDDEEVFRSTLAKRLAKRGTVVEQADSGQKCLDILEAKPVDVVVLDVKMPGMDGIEVLSRIKEIHPDIEVILLTGHATTEDGVEGIKSGAFDYLRKPVAVEHLVQKIYQAYEKIVRNEEKRRESEFRAAMEQQMITTERLAALGTLAAGVAHEINNPLAVMKEAAGWMAQLLRGEEMSDMPHREKFEMAIEKMEKMIDRAKRITHQLLEFVRNSDEAYSDVDLSLLMDEAINLVKREAVDKEIDIMQEVDDSLKTIFSDPYRLRQVFVNVITNAIHATGSGGKIFVILKGTDKGVRITIRDTGIGIPKENLEKIFNPFFTTKSPGQGTGLGLFVTRGIVEKLRGTIAVESQIGQGTSFHIELPGQCGPMNMPVEKNHVHFADERIKSKFEINGSFKGELRQ